MKLLFNFFLQIINQKLSYEYIFTLNPDSDSVRALQSRDVVLTSSFPAINLLPK